MQGFYKFTHIDSNTTTAITAVVLFGSLTVNTSGSGTTATVYNGTTSDNVIAVIDTSSVQGTFLYDAFIQNQLLTVVTSGGAAADLTVATY